MKEGPSARGENFEGGKRKLDLGGEGKKKEEKKEDEKEREGGGQGAAAFKKAADSIRATIVVVHGAPYRETNTTGITGKKIREGVERERD